MFTVSLTFSQRSCLIATLAIQNDRLKDYLEAFDQPEDEDERGRIHADIAENTALITHLKNAQVNA